jgi:myo-inositol-1-phosphate synthase
VPYANGAPHLTTEIPARIELAGGRQVPISGDFKTDRTIMNT